MSRFRLFLEWLAILACSCLIVWWAAASGATNRLDLQLLDAAAQRRAAPASDDLLIVAIDDRSLREVGQWPWDRAVMARLVDRLSEAGARAIVLDVLFVEPSRPASDSALADSIARSGKVALAHGFTAPVNRQEGFDPLPPLPELAAHALAVGHVALDPDPDGTVRRIPLFVRDQGRTFDHLQVALIRALSGLELTDLGKGESAPVLPLRAAGAYRTLPAASVLAGEVPASFLAGKVVLVGATAPGLGDTHAVPWYAGSAMAGVELQANLHQAITGAEFIAPIARSWALAISCGLLVILFLGFWRLRPAICLVLASLLVLGTMAASVAAAAVLGHWFAPGPAMLAMVLAYPLWGWRRLSAVSDFLSSEATKLAPASGKVAAQSGTGFDNVAKQVSLLRYLVDEIAERRTFLTKVIEAAPDAICVFGSDDRLLLMNGRARVLFTDGQDGMALQDLVLSAKGRFSVDGREMVLADGAAYAVATSRSAGEGGWSGGRIIAFVDITDIRRAEEDRRHMLEFLSHDMRSPQVAILGLAAGREGMAGPEERFDRITRHARRTLKLADDFVHLSRIAEAPLDLAEIDLVMLAEEAVDRAWFAAREKGILLRQHLAEEPAYIRADGHVLSRALDNLIGNAIKYSPEGSEVAVSIVRGGADIRLLIADQGPGLPPGRREDPFRRFGVRDKAAATGAGLGLAFVQAAVEKHGAAITCESGADGGTCFTIIFAGEAFAAA